ATVKVQPWAVPRSTLRERLTCCYKVGARAVLPSGYSYPEPRQPGRLDSIDQHVHHPRRHATIMSFAS
ncbi:MAG TPA: hypothetical protein VI365_09275, partial [Trebonia sp.]